MAATLVLAFASDRRTAHEWIDKAPVNSRVTVAGPKRSIDQNSILHAKLTRLSRSVTWHGQRLDVESWKRLVVGSMDKAIRMVPALDNDGFVMLGRSTADMSKADLSEVIDYLDATAAQMGWDVNGKLLATEQR